MKIFGRKISRKSPLTLNTLAPGKYEIEFGINDKFNTNIIHQKTLSIYIEKAFLPNILVLDISWWFIFRGYFWFIWKMEISSAKKLL